METIYFLLKVVGIAYLGGVFLILIFANTKLFFEPFGLIHFIISQKRKKKKNILDRSLWNVLPRATVVDRDIEGETFYLVCKSFFENPSNLREDRVIETFVVVTPKTFNEIKIGDVVFLECYIIKDGTAYFQVSKSPVTKRQFMDSMMNAV